MKFEDYKALLSEFLSFKSISTNPDFKGDIDKTANWLVDKFKAYGFDSYLLEGKETNPNVFAEYHVSDDAETILIYGHYDVQPADMSDGWESDPFELDERDGKLFGRGTVDNKGQVLIHMFTIGNLVQQNRLKYNVKFLIEGNEETGNEELGGIIASNSDLLSCDHVIISDGEITSNRPTLDVAFRGGANLTIKFKTAKNSLHSGMYGGAIPSASHEMSKFIASLYDANNRVKFEGFYKGVEDITDAEFDNNQSIEFDIDEFESITGINTLKTEQGLDFYSQTGLRPMLTVSGLSSGYTGEGYSNIVPNTAMAKINFRFITDQDPEVILEEFENYVSEVVPDYVEYEIDKNSSWKAIKLDVSNPKVQEATELLEEVYGKKVVYKYVGGSIPVIVDFKNTLGKETISISLGNEDCNMHGVDENFTIDLIKKALEFSEKFFSKE